MKHLTVPSLYLGNISYYQALRGCDSYTIEIFDHYSKQTFRNRCQILGSNGVIDLTVPVVKVSGVKTTMRDTKIDNSMSWQRSHFRSIMSSYRSSPYYEHFIDNFAPIYSRPYEYLLDLNMDLHHCVVKILRIKAQETLSTTFCRECEGDLRDVLSSKRGVEGCFESYYQVFSEKFSFVENLSVLDGIFCAGRKF